MAKKSESLSEGDADEPGGWLADEDNLDRRALWRLGWWGAGSVAAVTVAVLASQSSIGLRRDWIAATDLVRQAQQSASLARESQSEARRLASAIDTLNGDRDRLYSRVTVLEQGFESVTGSIARQNSAGSGPQPGVVASASSETRGPQAAPAAAAPATLAPPPDKPREAAISQPEFPAGPAATPLMPPRSMMAPPDPAATSFAVPEQPPPVIAAVTVPEIAASDPKQLPETPAQRTEFGVDLGGASSVDGLRALWRGLLAAEGAALSTLRPIMVVKERNAGPGLQLRLVAGPLSDAAAAVKICAALSERQRACETSVFDGQRLAMRNDAPQPAARPVPRKRVVAKRPANEATSLNPPPPAASSAVGTR